MKHMNIVITVIIAAAVLVAAYGVGLLVRHARTPDRQSGPAGMLTENPAILKMRLAQQSPGGRLAGSADSNQAARIQQERAQMLERTKNMTKEQKRRFMEEQARDRFSAASGKGRSRQLSPEEQAQMLEKWQSMSEEEKAAFGTRVAAPEPNDSEPNKAGKK